MSRLRKAGWAGGIGGLTALGIFAASHIGKEEGRRNHAYRDIVGVVTICDGETRGGVKMGDYKTNAECDALTVKALAGFENDLRRCVKEHEKIPDKSYVALLMLQYNIGSGAFCKSTVVRRLNAGDVRGACDAIPMFNRAGGKVVKGLVNRRAREQKLCLEGLKT
jgi:lysozyme